MGLWHFGQGLPPTMLDVKAEDDSDRVMRRYLSEAGARELLPLVAVTGDTFMLPAVAGCWAILLTSRNSEPGWIAAAN